MGPSTAKVSMKVLRFMLKYVFTLCQTVLNFNMLFDWHIVDLELELEDTALGYPVCLKHKSK